MNGPRERQRSDYALHSAEVRPQPCESNHLVANPLGESNSCIAESIASRASSRADARFRRQALPLCHRPCLREKPLVISREFFKVLDAQPREQLALLIQLLAHRDVGGELDPLGGLADGVRPYQALDGGVNATSPEVGAQSVLIIDVMAERRHQLAHLDGAPVRRALFPPRAGGARCAPRVWRWWSSHRGLLLLSGGEMRGSRRGTGLTAPLRAIRVCQADPRYSNRVCFCWRHDQRHTDVGVCRQRCCTQKRFVQRYRSCLRLESRRRRS